MHLIRDLWARVETIHAVTYFGEESREAARASGLKGFWMGYFGFRASPLGPVDADVVSSAFYNFAPRMVARSIPDAWHFADPRDLIRIRTTAAAATLRRVASKELDIALTVLRDLCEAARTAEMTNAGLCASNRSLVARTDPVEELWQACTTLREQRGDAHVQALREANVSGCDAHLLIVAERQIPDAVLRDNRGWTDEEWNDCRRSLVQRGLIADDGSLTTTGHALREAIEIATDQASQVCWSTVGEGVVQKVCEQLYPLAVAVAESGTIPFPNPMGLLDIRESGAS